jgi:4-oxalomesaconate tautomerase
LLKNHIEKIRLQAGYLMNLGDVSEQTIPKMCLISTPKNGGVINTRMFIPHVIHEAIGVLAAVSVATACVIPNTITEGICIINQQLTDVANALSIEHPSGEFTVTLDYTLDADKITVHKSGVLRTARLLSSGNIFIPA